MDLDYFSQTPQGQSQLASALDHKDTILWDNYKDSIAYLYEYLLQLLRDKFYLENQNEFQRRIDFLGHVHTYLSNPGNFKYVTLSASFIHYTISVIIETIHIIVCLNISKKALNSGIIPVSCGTHYQMKNLLSMAKDLEERVFHLEKSVEKVCCKTNTASNLQSLSKIMEQIKNIKSISKYLLKSSIHLADILTKKVDSKLRYFDWMSLTVSVLCVGQIIHSLVIKKGNTDLSQLCLWFTCVGSSAVVVQLPRMQFGIIRSIFTHHTNEYNKLSKLFQLEVKKKL
ncbi:uncharacterized protein LOC106873621 isoform X2 [Octopus bimaculoides]|uniref:Uncharacterized protein n=1 Tax=Octopus bimaculoides TaxID=37653 RepID=A0A0L8ICX8_OCTBM|nr:uncharacterized protein LOC106873621 isoform X2 [Octopus bimaculoides]|eukprot:XP_014776557.1 PREDICTED: uncharacterized protein LOC106873621 [Octopus bimaculoides]